MASSAAKGTGAECRPGHAALAVRLLKHLAAAAASSSSDVDGAAGNLIFSPLSIYAALALVAAGARDPTLEELLGVLGAPSRDALARFVAAAAKRALTDRSASGGPCVAFASGVWCDASRALKPAFLDAVVGSHNATTSAVDFRNKPKEACQKINAWVAEVTRNLITSVLNPTSVRPDTVLVLANAVYFKGLWRQPFDEKHTADMKFFLRNGSSVKVPFMQSWEDQFIACYDDFKVLEMPYKNRDVVPFPDMDDPNFWELIMKRDDRATEDHPRFSMCVFLPSARDGLQSLVDRIASEEGFLARHLPKMAVAVDEFRVPKFKLSFSGSVVGILDKLGVRLPFDRRRADLSDMVEDAAGTSHEPVFVRDMFHRAVIEVNEEGSEAAAANVVEDDFCGMDDPEPPKLVNFVAEHPFAFFIIEEKSGTIVFAGQVLDPSVDE